MQFSQFALNGSCKCIAARYSCKYYLRSKMIYMMTINFIYQSGAGQNQSKVTNRCKSFEVKELIRPFQVIKRVPISERVPNTVPDHIKLPSYAMEDTSTIGSESSVKSSSLFQSDDAIIWSEEEIEQVTAMASLVAESRKK